MGSVQGVEKRGLKVGEVGKKYTTFHNVLQSKKCKEVGTKKGLELGLKGSGKFRPFHCPPPPTLPPHSFPCHLLAKLIMPSTSAFVLPIFFLLQYPMTGESSFWRNEI